MDEQIYTDNEAALGLAAAGSFLAIFLVIFMILMIVIIVSKWKIYKKAGKPGWTSIIPIYDTIIFLEIVGKPLWWIVLLLIPGVNLVIAIILINLLSKSFGKSTGFTLGLIFLPIIFYPILAFGNAKYLGEIETKLDPSGRV